jgi:amino acid adenylation domain-containing protein
VSSLQYPVVDRAWSMVGDRAPDEHPSLLHGEPLPAANLRPVPETIAEYADTHPGTPAVRCGQTVMSYMDLVGSSRRMADALTEAGVRPGDRVAILAEPSAAAIAALLAVLRAGAAYVPIDPAQPAERIDAILADSAPTTVMVSPRAEPLVARAVIPVVRLSDRGAVAGEAAPVPLAATDAAYLIYTSGSTGEPKGVVVEHGQLAASTLARRMVYPGAPVFLLVSPLAFDSSAAGAWGTLTAGGCLVVARPEEVRDPERLLGLIEEHGVTRTLCVPSLYSALLDADDHLGGLHLRSVETVIVAGESLPDALVERHFARLPGVELVNEYGPTEATVWASCHRFTEPAPVTIGGPIPGAHLYVLDDGRLPVPPREAGELWIGGAGVAQGYAGRPAATARSFLPDPFASAAGARMYRTGDLVRVTPEGRLEFLGRLDDQVKVRGHRIELGAVEAGLRSIPAVESVAVLPNADRSALIAFVVASGDVTAEALRREAASRMPPSMVPSRILRLDEIPLTYTGKVDRARLRDLADERRVEAAPMVLDLDTGKVAAAWSEVLNLPEVPVDANFFDLGGHSLAIFKLQDALQRHAGVRPSMTALFEHATVAAQAALIGGRRGGEVSLDGTDR